MVQVNGILSYFDRLPDGFYQVNGMDPYAWTISADQGEIGLMPSIESLRAIDPHTDLSVTVVLIDRLRDPSLKELQNWVLKRSSSWISTKDAINQLACLVCNQMGYVCSSFCISFRFNGFMSYPLGIKFCCHQQGCSFF